ncbi:FkbM family methyltransferase [Brevundimonas sp.]|uniref:FkbM family methyltransferase n=1 Tax=Brevundimonas sp. TaxID=1871086 RepID=UPI002869F399|nr:FkbM family methyltransferase [Brevundimonas sp.]
MRDTENATAVADLYRGFLGREPDPSAETMIKALDEGTVTFPQIINAFLRSPEFGLVRETRRKADSLTNDQTQFGEFMILLTRMLRTDGQRVIVDVGARGKERSNSYDLLKSFGWRGILVEANPALADQIRIDFAGLDVALEVCAASDFEGEATFHIGVNDDVSSLNQAASLGWGETLGEITVKVVRLPTLLERHGVSRDFDLLSIDIEGEDIKVLNDTVAAGWTPRWVIIEASNDFIVKTLEDAPFSEGVRSAYSIVGQTCANLILERKES